MKKQIGMLLALLMLAACSPAPQADQEFGNATRYSFEMQIAYPDQRYADKSADGTTGLVAEGIMGVYTDGFDRPPKEVDVFEMGVGGEN